MVNEKGPCIAPIKRYKKTNIDTVFTMSILRAFQTSLSAALIK